MAARALTGTRGALHELDETELERLARVAERRLAARPLAATGPHLRERRAGRGVEFLEFRAWAPGEDPRDIDWRASARTGRLQLRRYRDEASSDVFLCLDRSASMGVGDGAKWHLALQLVASLGYVLLATGNRVALLAFSDDVDAVDPLGRGRARYSRLLSRLETLVPPRAGGGSCLESCARQLPAGASALVVSDFLAPDHLRRGLDALAARGGAVRALQVIELDELPLELGAEDRVVLRDVESGERVQARAGHLLDARAQTRLADMKRALAAHCRSRGIALSTHPAGETWRDAVLRHLGATAGLQSGAVPGA
ncbi:MAG: DUF58 domain-containing protein [Proteobacteria bacterium]|nr:DUF58 domain-containing protein [Pseudomonadota bacterium]